MISVKMLQGCAKLVELAPEKTTALFKPFKDFVSISQEKCD